MKMVEEDNLDVVLIYPALSVKERYGNREMGDVGGHLPPLGILSVAAYLRKNSYSVGVLDALARGWGPEEIVEYIIAKKPKVVGFSAITPIFHRAVDCAKRLKVEFPQLLTVIGGHHATILYRDVIKENKCFDIVVFGEGESTMAELMDVYKSTGYNYNRAISDYDLFRGVDGIVFRTNKEIVINKERELINDLNELPCPARDLVQMEKYRPLPNQYKRLPVAHMVVIRGCPYQCSFCSNNFVFGSNIRARSPQKVVEEISLLIDNYGVKEISFWDDMMTVNKKWMNEFCGLIIKNRLDITWTCYARADTVTKELLQTMADAGCWNIFFGFESGVQQLLDNLNKGITLQDIRNANRWCKEAGIEVRASFMIALPGETPVLAQKTIDFAKELNPEYAQFCITTPYPGTKLFNEAHKWGTLSYDYSKYNIWEPVFVPSGYNNKKQIVEMEKRANVQFYFRPRAVLNLIKHIRSWEDIRRYIKGFRALLGFIKK